MISREHNGYKHEISRASYTRRVWKTNHYAFGNWTPGCWNTVHCGPRDASYTLAHSQATVAACEIMKISRAEFQYFFEKTDQGNAIIHVEMHDERFNWKGKTYTFTRGCDKRKVIAKLKELELYGNADAERKIAKVAQDKEASEALKAKRAAAVARTAKLMRRDLPPPAGPAIAPSARKKEPILCAEKKYGCPIERIPEFRAWCAEHHVTLYGVRMPQRVAMFLKEPETPPVDIVTLAQIFAPFPQYLLLPAPDFVLPVPQSLANQFSLSLPPALSLPELEVNELESLPPFYNKIYEVDPAKTSHEPFIGTSEPETIGSEPVSTVVSTKEDNFGSEKAPIVPISFQRKSQEGTLTLPKKRVRKLIDCEEKADVMFYGKRRRTQAQFRHAVALNCFDRCVISGASLIRCEAAHLLAHARKGGASFKNGLLLRADLHTLFDAGECAIDPQAMTIHFSLTILASDPDLATYEGKVIRTLKPIKATNLEDRWTAFLIVYMDTAA